MKKYLAIVCATMLCVCCLALAACGGSSSSSSAAASSASASGSAASASASAASASASAASASASSAAAASSSAANPSDKFIGDWQICSAQMNGVTIYGDLTDVVGAQSNPLTISKDGTGSLSFAGNTVKFTWTQAGDNAINLSFEQTGDSNSSPLGTSMTYKDGILSLELSSDGNTGALMFSKDGKAQGLDPITMDNAKPITSKDALVGTWKMTAASMEGKYMKGEPDAVSSAIGMPDASITFNADGTATAFGGKTSWTVDSNGAALAEGEISLPVMALGDNIAIDLGKIMGTSMIAVFSK